MDGIRFFLGLAINLSVMPLVLWFATRLAWKEGVRSGWIACKYPDIASQEARREVDRMLEDFERIRNGGK